VVQTSQIPRLLRCAVVVWRFGAMWWQRFGGGLTVDIRKALFSVSKVPEIRFCLLILRTITLHKPQHCALCCSTEYSFSCYG
jgi:hypothetical protein